MKASTVSPSVAVNWNRAVQACKRWWPFHCKPIPLMGPFLTYLLAGLTLSNSRNTSQCASGWSPQSPLPGFRIYPFLNVTEGHRCPQRHLWENKDSAITEVGQFTQEQAINCAFLNSLTLLRGEYTRGHKRDRYFKHQADVPSSSSGALPLGLLLSLFFCFIREVLK